MLNEPRLVDVKVEGEETGMEYTGKFHIKPFLEHGERADAVRLAESYALGINTQDQRNFLLTLALLKFHVVKADASWWDEGFGLKMLDESPVWKLAEEVEGIRDEINPKRKKKITDDVDLKDKDETDTPKDEEKVKS